jgi:hypothetical protein
MSAENVELVHRWFAEVWTKRRGRLPRFLLSKQKAGTFDNAFLYQKLLMTISTRGICVPIPINAEPGLAIGAAGAPLPGAAPPR